MNNHLGKVDKDQHGFRVRFVREYPFPMNTVWDAITNPEKLRIWFTDVEMDFVPGGKLTIFFRDAEKTKSHGRIITIEAPRLFVYTWEDELAEWELTDIDGKSCRLQFTYSRLADEYAIHVPSGWHIILDQLDTVLHGHSEPFPFGGEQTPEGQQMIKIYTSEVLKQFPELKTDKI